MFFYIILFMNNIILIGMPGVGKSTVGVLLAKALGMDFIDTDLIIQKKMKRTLQDIIDSEGLEYFIELENEIVSEVCVDETVVATGGSVVYGQAAMDNLKKQGKVVYLELECSELLKRLSNIQTRGVAMKKGQSLENLLEERDILYRKYADFTLSEDGLSIEETVTRLVSEFKKI